MHLALDGWLCADAHEPLVTHVPSVRSRTLACPAPVGVVWHWTGSLGRSDQHARALAEEIREGSGASWHVLIARSGLVLQSVPTTRGANHVGRLGQVAGAWRGVNSSTVGIELENPGRVIRAGDASFQVENPAEPRAEWRPSALRVPEELVEDLDGELFCRFSSEQERSAELVLRALVERFGWKREVCAYGHAQFDPGRKADPGRLWLERVLPRVVDRVFPTVMPAV